jgi:hemin uptake protein HemP
MSDRPSTPKREAATEDQPAPAHPAEGPRRIKVSELLGGRREVILEHDGQEYRLRITASRKLLLTK